MAFREFFLFISLASPAAAQEVSLPVSVCEVARDITAWEGKPVAILGRYSKRSGGQWLAQEHCAGQDAISLRLIRDATRAPRFSDSAYMNQDAVDQMLKQIHATTSLARLRFGSPDFDRWAVVFGMIERSKTGLQLIFRGDGMVFFYPEPSSP